MKIAEVVGVNDSFQYDSSKSSRLFSISVRTISDNIEKEYTDVVPASLNDLKIPLIGEHVIIFKGIGFLDSNKNKTYRWYYFSTYNLQSSINHSLSPGVSYDPSDVSNTELLESNQTFEERSISPMQPYEGDNIYQSRWGSSMRFGSTTSATNAHISPTWVEGDNGDPIIVLSNTKTNKPNKEYVVENLAKDYSGLWLTSTQRLTTLKLNIDTKNSRRSSYQSQFIGVADRVVIQSKSDIVAIDGKTSVEMRAPEIVIGSAKQKEGILHSTETIKALNALYDLITYALQGPSGIPISIASEYNSIVQRFIDARNNIQSKNILIDKADSI